MKKTSSFNIPTTMMTFQRGEKTSNFEKNEKTQNREKVKNAKNAKKWKNRKNDFLEMGQKWVYDLGAHAHPT